MLATMELLLLIICVSALVGFVTGVASGYDGNFRHNESEDRSVF